MLALSVVTSVCLLALLSSLAAAAGPDLLVTKVSLKAPAQLSPGSSFQASLQVKNAGRGAAASKVAFHLSRDAKLGRGDVKLATATVRRLKSHGAAPAQKRLRIPSEASGSYKLLACADAARKVKEGNERNNCKAAKATLRIGAGSVVGGAPGTGNPDQPGSSGSPLKVSFSTEGGNGVTRVVAASGGEISVEGGDGTEYSLFFPPDSLFSDTKVTMTPLASLSGAPLSGGMAGGVKLEPEGLTLNEPATLTIDPVGPGPASGSETGFLAQGDGDDFHLYPLAFGPGLSLKLLHFTIAGAGGATSGDRSAAAGQTPVTSQAQWEAQVADRVNLAHEREAAGTPDGEWPRDLEPVHLAYYENVVKPAMDAALNDEAAVDAAIREGLGWLRKVELFGDPSDPDFDGPRGQIYTQLGEILENALKRVKDSCTKSHDLRAIRRIVQIARTGQLLGYDLGTGLEDVAKCLRFELDMESRIVYPEAEYHVALKDVLLEANYSNEAVTVVGADGEKQIEWVNFESHSEGEYECPPDEDPPSMNFVETNDDGATEPTARAVVTFDISPLQQGTPAPADDTFGAQIAFDTNEPTETYKVTGSGPCVEPGTYTGLVWENQWANSLLLNPSPLYEVVKQGEAGSFSAPITTFTRVQRGDGEALLEVLLNESIAAGINEQVRIEVFHRPLG